MNNYKISIITINLNNREGLKKTIQSVLEQDYTDLEYLVIDGDSSDGSQGIVESKGDKIDFFLSEKDNGVYEAMNKGIIKASGEYLLFLNSGDRFAGPNSLSQLIKSATNQELIFGNILVEDGARTFVKKYPPVLSFRYFYYDSLPHPACLISRKLFQQVGLYDTHLKIASDWKFFMLAVIKNGCTYLHVDQVISIFDTNGMSSSPGNFDTLELERRSTLKRYFNINYKFYSIYLKVLRRSFYKKI